jgi:hypothetical protein
MQDGSGLLWQPTAVEVLQFSRPVVFEPLNYGAMSYAI